VESIFNAARKHMPEARRQGWGNLDVVADREHLPFLSDAFSGIVCQGAIERVGDDRAFVVELRRISKPGGTVVLVAPNRHNAATLRFKARNWWRGWRRTPQQYLDSSAQLRTYTWSELEGLVAPLFTVRARVPIGWGKTRSRRLITRLLVWQLRQVSREILIEANPR
jgi:ubiquinone/menaquinone biosynthesis C-methylase UbiE